MAPSLPWPWPEDPQCPGSWFKSLARGAWPDPGPLPKKESIEKENRSVGKEKQFRERKRLQVPKGNNGDILD